jgi:hypothetical protein
MAATLLVLASPVYAQQPDITAALNRDRIHVGETTVLTIQVESHSSRAIIREPPMPAGLAVIGSSDFSQFQMSAPGRRVRWTRREVASPRWRRACTASRPPPWRWTAARTARTNSSSPSPTRRPAPRTASPAAGAVRPVRRRIAWLGRG